MWLQLTRIEVSSSSLTCYECPVFLIISINQQFNTRSCGLETDIQLS